MNLVKLYSENKTALKPPTVRTPYQQFVFDLQKRGLNTLVGLNQKDPGFVAPPPTRVYTGLIATRGSAIAVRDSAFDRK